MKGAEAKKYHTLLLDVDGTLLDFHASERQGISRILMDYGFPASDELLEKYHQINDGYWQAFNRGEISKERLCRERFVRFFGELGLSVDGEDAEKSYRAFLDGSAILLPGALETCRKLSGKYDCYVVTNGTYPLDLPEADLILLSLDGDREHHNAIRGDTYDTIFQNIRNATADNICFYMAINQINKDSVRDVCLAARDTPHVKAVSFNFHTPYPDTKELALSKEEKAQCCRTIAQMMEEGAPVFNLKSAFPYLIDNSFPTPCHQCVVMENGELSTCGRCIHVPGLCQQCGYFFVAEYTLLFQGNPKVILEMPRTYLKYI